MRVDDDLSVFSCLFSTWKSKQERRAFYDVLIENRNLNRLLFGQIEGWFHANGTGKWEQMPWIKTSHSQGDAQRKKMESLMSTQQLRWMMVFQRNGASLLHFASKEMHSFPFFMVQLKHTEHSTHSNEYVWHEHTSMRKHRCSPFFDAAEWRCDFATMLTKSWHVVTRTQHSRRIVTWATIN